MIAEHHPTVLEGDSTVDIVTFVLDAQGAYVASQAGKQPDRRVARDFMPISMGRDSTTRRVVQPSTIKSVEVMKYRAGTMRADPLGVIVIRLK